MSTADGESDRGGGGSPGAAASSGHSGRLLIVANRLPVSMSIKQRGDGPSDISFSTSAGGLVSALAGTDMKSFWIGWPGGEVKGKDDRQTVVDKLRALGSIPVFLSNALSDLFYNGFCNDLLWPLFHYQPLPISAIKQHDQQFIAYQKANAEFAKVVLAQWEEGDTVWVHDYHLMLLPSLLRQARPSMRIGFFFHTPFPSSEIYRAIPSRDELLYGVLSSNLLGFHTHDYSRHFQSAATRIVGAQCSNEVLTLNGAVSHLGTFPIGIDPKRFVEALETDAVQRHLQELRQQFAGRRVLLGIDRLDYIKGIPHKLHALELFFDRHPQFVGNVVLVQIAIPSRTDVVEYQRLKTSTHELVGRINGRFGSVASVPIHYLDQSIPFDKMCALNRVADCLVVTSVRDGMNLVAYEYIACQRGSNGVLILSEFAGAAQSLGAGALQVNPWNISEVADAIHKALTMPEKERQERTDYCFNHVMTHTARAWAREFVEVLETISVQGDGGLVNGSASSSSLSSLAGSGSETSNQMTAAMPSPLDVDALISSFSQSHHRLIITGLAGIVSRAAALGRGGAGGASSSAAAVAPLTHIESNYEEHAGELWGWQESKPDAPQPAGSSAGSGSGGGGRQAPARLPLPQSSASGPSRYSGHFRRQSSFASLPSSSNAAEHSMEEWMEMSGAAGADGGGDDELHSKQQPTVDELRAAIVSLASDPNTTYLLLTSRSREWCDDLFRSVPNPPPNLWFAAENGYFFKHGAAKHAASSPADTAAAAPAGAASSSPPSAFAFPSSPSGSSASDWHVMYENVDFGWMEGVHRVMLYFSERTPRSFIQVQETSMQWHYGDAEPVFAKRQALDLISHLTGGPLSNTATEVLDSANIVQVRPLAVSKGRALKHLLAYLHRRYRRELHSRSSTQHGRQQQLQRRAETIASDSDEDGQPRVGEEEQSADAAAPAQPRTGLNPAAIQSALAESGILLEKEGEQAGYEEDDEGEDDGHRQQQDGRAAAAGSRSAAAAAVSSSSSARAVLSAPRSALQIRSRRPSLADEAAEQSNSGGSGAADATPNRSASSHSLAFPYSSPTASPSHQSWAQQGSAAASASAAHWYVPLDFVLCIGNFLERDEDIFPLLNDWGDSGSLPPGLLSHSHTPASQHATPAFHNRRISLASAASAAASSSSSPTGSEKVTAGGGGSGQSASQSVHPQQQPGGGRKAATAELSGPSTSPSQSPSGPSPAQPAFASPLSSTSLSDIVSPSNDAAHAAAAAPSPPSLSIWTVTVGSRPSRARFALPDLAAVNSLIVQLAACRQQQPQQQLSSAASSSSSAVVSPWQDGKQGMALTHGGHHEPDDKEDSSSREGGKLKAEPTMHS